jgi:hypothetical protein
MTTALLEQHGDDHDEGIPAADPGPGAPAPADGFGVGGEEPDAPEGTRDDAGELPATPEDPAEAPAGETDADDPGGSPAGMPEDTPFRTPEVPD